MTVFIRLTRIAPDSKANALQQAIVRTASTGEHEEVFSFDSVDLAALPGAPFAYWLPSKLRAKIRASAPFAQEERTALQGLITGDDARFVRLWWEVSPSDNRGPRERKWVPFTKGGKRSHLYADVSTVVRYDNVGQVGISQVGRYGRGATHYYRPGLSWPLRGTRYSAYAVPAGCIFSVGGKMAFAPSHQLLASLGLFNGAAFNAFLMVRAGKVGGVQYEAGLLQQAPVPDLDSDACAGLGMLAETGWRLRYQLDSVNEASHAFTLPVALRKQHVPLRYEELEYSAREIEGKIDEQSFSAYGLDEEEQRSLEGSAEQLAVSESGGHEVEDENDDEAGQERGLFVNSWLVGASFGRFDPRLATGERPIPPDPKPFDSLPIRSPGMYSEGEEPADRPDILVDDEGHKEDLAARARAVAERVKVDVPENLRGWLAKEFFPLHIKMYSKSRRKAPIYWQIATPSASYSVWIYIHAFTKDTLFRVQNDYVTPKLAHEERRLEVMNRELRDKSTTKDRKALAAQETFVEELRAFLDEVKRIAPLWNPDLDDGVIINFAPLWRLVPQHKPWQKELKAIWDALCAGKCDWAHLAMHLWPERVVPKCATDRSLAIAHGLEDVFWVESDDGKWTARKTPARPVEELVRERTSAAVKAALKSLLEAPTLAGPGRRRKGKRDAH